MAVLFARQGGTPLQGRHAAETLRGCLAYYIPIAMTSILRFRTLSLLALAGVFLYPLAPAQTAPAAPPTVADALAFIDHAEKELNALSIDAARASWVEETYITDDTVALLAQANDRL